jgi:preprotein translocase subunit SecA
MVTAIREETIRRIFLVQLRPSQEIIRKAVARVTGASGGNQEKPKQQPIRVTAKPKPNDKCPCGSGLKYKRCCYLKNKQEQ